jgi:hypothetical protein
MFSAALTEQCLGEAIDHNDDRPLVSLSPYPKFTVQKRLQTGVRETVVRQTHASEARSTSRQKSHRLEEKKPEGLFPPVVCGRRSLSLAHGPVGFPVSFHDLAGITQQVLRSFISHVFDSCLCLRLFVLVSVFVCFTINPGEQWQSQQFHSSSNARVSRGKSQESS